MDHCTGHSHDHGDHSSGDDLGRSLRPQIDLDGVRCLNEEIPNSGRQVLKFHEDRLTMIPYLKSQEDDPELLLYIPFTEAVIVQSISIQSLDSGNPRGQETVIVDGAVAGPRMVKLFVDRDDLDFETARELQPQMQLELVPAHHHVEDGTIDYQLRPAGRFQGISSLTIFVVNNYSGNDDDEDDELPASTIISYVGVKGRGTNQKRAAVEAIYEVKPMPEGNKMPGMNNTSLANL